MEKFNTEIFKNKTLSGLFSDIYKNTTDKKTQINALIMELKPLIKDVQNATILVPLIAEYLEVSVKNDDQLVKIAGIAQRLISSDGKNETVSFMLTQEEKNFLLNEAQNKTLELEYQEVKKLNE